MVDLDTLDPDALRRLAFRRRRTWAAAIVGNALVLLGMVGGPWQRGRNRAVHARRGFGALAACLWEAEPNPAAGLTLPAGDLAHYADASRKPGWPERCAPLADAVLPPPVFFVFPAVRAAEADARRAVEVVRQELRQASSSAGLVPTRPRLAMLRLSAALAVLAREASAEDRLRAPAVLLNRRPSAVLPERIPLQLEPSATLEVRGWADGVELLARGERALSWVRVGGGRLDPRRFRRPAALHGTVHDGRTPWLLWWTAEARCGPQGCAQRALGLAPLSDESVVTPTPRWLASHPSWGSRSVLLAAPHVWVAARTTGGVELRRFTLPPSVARTDRRERGRSGQEPAEAPPQPPDLAWPLPGALRAEAGDEAAWWIAEEALHRLRAGQHRRLAALRGARGFGRDGPWLAVWGTELVVLHEERIVTRRDVPGTGAVRLVRVDGGAFVVAEGRGGLQALACTPDGCGRWFAVASRAWRWDVAPHGAGAMVAWTESERGAIAVRLLGEGAGAIRFPAPCFDTDALTGEPTGMCGRPLLAAADGRVFLVAREGQDAWIVEYERGRWRPLRGLR